MQVDEIDEPDPRDDEVVVNLTHAGVNPIDIRVAEGGAGRPPLPFTPGCEAAGTVDDEPVLVYGAGIGTTRNGTYAQQVLAPADAVIPLPTGVAPRDAAGLGLAGVTAWGALHETAGITSDDRVLVLGASGGVGTLAVQLAAAAGCDVLAQTSTDADADLLRSRGAADVVVTDAGTLRDSTREFKPTVVIDPLGGDFTDQALRSLATAGRIVVFGVAAGQRCDLDLAMLYRKAATLRGHAALTMPQDRVRRALDDCLRLMADGALSVHIDDVVPLADINDVHTRLLERRATGKLLLSVSP